MKKLAFGAIGAALAVSTIASARWGGWAVVTVDNVPDRLVVGKPQVFSFVVRQHGVDRMRGLSPSIEARSGGMRVAGRAWQSLVTGTYSASITVPEAGDWSITIESGFGSSKARLLPLRAGDSTQRMAALTEAERGRHLFAAKGCIACHVHRAVDLETELRNAAPDLTDRRFAADYLARYLADPSIKPQSPGMMRMPNLALREPEIASLVAFINTEQRLSRH